MPSGTERRHPAVGAGQRPGFDHPYGGELSIVCQSDAVTDGVRTECGFRALKIEGPFDFSLTGILLAVIGPLADAGISIFALSTYDTDYVLVKKNDLKQAVSVLQASGHTFR